MSDHLDRAAEVIAPVLLRDYAMQYDTSHATADEFMDLARDAARALADADLLAFPERDAAVAAKALREAVGDRAGWMDAATYLYLQGRADRIEREAGESDADA